MCHVYVISAREVAALFISSDGLQEAHTVICLPRVCDILVSTSVKQSRLPD